MERVRMAVAGLIIGGFLGWFMGVAWYELIEVPKAAFMDPATAPSYLCATGNVLSPMVAHGLYDFLAFLVVAREYRRRAASQPPPVPSEDDSY